MGLQQQPNDSG